ncbi:MAG: hypothetical protein ABIQ15_07905 [Nocardioides sp.]
MGIEMDRTVTPCPDELGEDVVVEALRQELREAASPRSSELCRDETLGDVV